MKKIKLVFGTTNSQPPGNNKRFLEKAYQEAYKPFLTLLYNFPEISTTLHYSGVLFEWLDENHPEFLMLLNDMVKSKQVELLGGGFYEPVLPLIPNTDKVGQIELLTTYIRKKFGKRPRGSWITERVWEPSIASTLKNSGIDYIFLDDHHFLSAGFDSGDICSPCITEDQGKTLIVYPISKKIREMFLISSPEDVISEIVSLSSATEDRIVTIIEDGSAFGLYRNSNNLSYKKGWLKKFFELLIGKKDIIETVSPGSYVKNRYSFKKGYFPSTSYEEMMKWTLSPEQQKSFQKIKLKVSKKDYKRKYLSGGFFRQFLTRYPESNLLYSKMIYTNILVNQIRRDKSRKNTAREELWRGQCHNAYWHGKYGGLYKNYIRKAAYKSFLEAEKITREKGIFIPSVVTADFDMDGNIEYLYQGHDLNAYIHRKGGVMFELDYLPKTWNYLDTMARHKELYHYDETIFVKKNVGFDGYSRKAFIDHFFNKDEKITAFDLMQYKEMGDFIEKEYKLEEFDREHKELTLKRTGFVKILNKAYPVEVRKKYVFKRISVDVFYTITNLSKENLDLCFGSEINLSLVSKGVESQRIYKIDRNKRTEIKTGKSITKDTVEVLVHDLLNDVNILLSSSRPFELWSLPVETTVKCTTGFETFFQSTCFVPRWKLSIPPSETWETSISISINKN